MTDFYLCNSLGNYVSTTTATPFGGGVVYTLDPPPLSAGYHTPGYRYWQSVVEASGCTRLFDGFWTDVHPWAHYYNGFEVDDAITDRLGNVQNKRLEVYEGTTNASGDLTITYSESFSTRPHVNPQLVTSDNIAKVVRVVSHTQSGGQYTGCVLRAETRNTATVLTLEVLLAAVVPISGAAISVLVRER